MLDTLLSPASNKITRDTKMRISRSKLIAMLISCSTVAESYNPYNFIFDWTVSNNGCPWDKYTENDWGYFPQNEVNGGNCDDCKLRCELEENCSGVECGTDYCSYWRNAKCSQDEEYLISEDMMGGVVTWRVKREEMGHSVTMGNDVVDGEGNAVQPGQNGEYISDQSGEISSVVSDNMNAPDSPAIQSSCDSKYTLGSLDWEACRNGKTSEEYCYQWPTFDGCPDYITKRWNCVPKACLWSSFNRQDWAYQNEQPGFVHSCEACIEKCESDEQCSGLECMPSMESSNRRGYCAFWYNEKCTNPRIPLSDPYHGGKTCFKPRSSAIGSNENGEGNERPCCTPSMNPRSCDVCVGGSVITGDDIVFVQDTDDDGSEYGRDGSGGKIGSN